MLYKTLDAPLSIHLEVNTRCNQKCTHCYNFWRKEEKAIDSNLNKLLAERIIEQLKKFNVFHVILNGGEPLMNFSSLIFLIRKFSENQISCSLNTNLTLLTEKSAKKLKDAGLRIILTSLLSHEPETHDYLTQSSGSFKRLQNGFEVAHKTGFRITANMVVSRVNKNQIIETGLLAKKLGAKSFSATRVMPPRPYDAEFEKSFSLKQEDTSIIINSLMKLHTQGIHVESLIPYPLCSFSDSSGFLVLGGKSCSAGKTSCVIGADGFVRACPHDNKTYGNIMNNSLGAIWQNMQEWRDGVLVPHECISCKLFSHCGGGCRMTTNQNCEKDVAMRLKNAEMGHYIVAYPNPKPIYNDSIIQINRSCKFRADKDLYIINAGGMKNIFVTEKTYNLLKFFHIQMTQFTVTDIISKYGFSITIEKCKEFFALLELKGVVTILK